MKSTLRPVISSLQKIVVYETKSRLVVVGSNAGESVFRVVRVERGRKEELRLEDDGRQYTKAQISHYLNTALDRPRTQLRTVSAFGILGFVRLLEGYYLVLITKRRRIAVVVGLHSLYKIEDTCMLYVPSEVRPPPHPDEARYLKIFLNIDLSSNFYYSYSYDITNTVQVNLALPENLPSTSPPEVSEGGTEQDLFGQSYSTRDGECKFAVRRGEPHWRFVWNGWLLRPCQGQLHPDWILHVIHGFVCQSNISVFGRSVYLTLIARRSARFAGTRFLKRGANFQGDVANEVETEQIVEDMGVSCEGRPRVCSFVQLRGSIPGHWSQDLSKIVPKPTIAYDLSDPFAETAGRHFENLLKRYGSPIIVVNLVKQRETKKHESTLSEQFAADIKYLNQFLPPPHSIQYVTFDMARNNKRKEATVMGRLGKIGGSAIEKTGIFCSELGQVQTGLIRVNCVDCLDRTNTAQFALGKAALTLQLKKLGLLEGKLEFDCDCTRLLEALYEDHGDTLALQYGGSQLVHRIKTYRKTAPWTSQGNDIMQTLSRYYSNTFSDQEKQHGINLFLGLYVPREGSTPIWELATDYFMHNPPSPVVSSLQPRRALTQWWSSDTMACLPCAHSLVHKRCGSADMLSPGPPPPHVDIFADFHRIHEFTPLPDISSFITSHTVRDFMPHCVTEYSPFRVRGQPGRRREDNRSKNPSLTGHSSPSSTTSSASSSVESEEEDVSRQGGGSQEAESPLSPTPFHSLFPSMKATYGIALSNPTKQDSLLYKRYVLMSQAESRGRTGCRASLPTSRRLLSNFPPHSSYQVSVKKVSEKAKEIYGEYVRREEKIRDYLTPGLVEKYARYINHQIYLFPPHSYLTCQ